MVVRSPNVGRIIASQVPQNVGISENQTHPIGELILEKTWWQMTIILGRIVAGELVERSAGAMSRDEMKGHRE